MHPIFLSLITPLYLTVQARTKWTTQTRNWRNVCISLDEGTYQRWWASASAHTCQEGKDFIFVIHCNHFALWCIIVKNKTNSRVWRSSIVTHSKDFSWGTLVDKFSVVEGFIFEITWHSTFICNYVVPENIHTPPPQPTKDHCKFRGGGGFKRSYFRGVGGVHGKLLFQRVMNHEQNTESNVQSIVRTKT